MNPKVVNFHLPPAGQISVAVDKPRALAAPHPGRSLGWPGRSNWCGRWWGLRAIPSTSRRATTSCQGGETVRHPLADRKRPLDTKWLGYARSTGWHEGLRWKREGAHRKDSQVPRQASAAWGYPFDRSSRARALPGHHRQRASPGNATCGTADARVPFEPRAPHQRTARGERLIRHPPVK
jgi:hypothetical protein